MIGAMTSPAEVLLALPRGNKTEKQIRMVGQNRTSYNPKIDVALLKEIINHNPFVDASKWGDVVKAVKDIADTAPTTSRSVRERTTLLKYFKKDQMRKINKSGTDEEYTERQELLQEVTDLFNDRERIKSLKKQKKAASSATDIRKRAMETLKDAEPEDIDDEDMTAGDNDETKIVQGPKRMRITPSMAKRDMLTYLETKSQNSKNQNEQELALRKQEHELSKARFSLDKKEREANIEAEEEARTSTHDMEVQHMALRREELGLSKAKFDLEKKEREAKIELDRQEKMLMHEMMKT